MSKINSILYYTIVWLVPQEDRREESRSEPEEAAAAENCTWTCAVGPGIFTFPFFKEQLSLDLSLISKSKGQLISGY
jgi:hypothetical protein